MPGIAAPAAAAGLVFGIGRLAENDAIAILCRSAYKSLAGNPSGDGFAFVFFVECVVLVAWRREDHFHVDPVAGGIDDDEFIAAIGVADSLRVGARGNADCFGMHKCSADRIRRS